MNLTVLLHPRFQAKNYHTAEVRRRLATFMCHDTTTADRFYAMHLDADQAGRVRADFEAATSATEARPQP